MVDPSMRTAAVPKNALPRTRAACFCLGRGQQRRAVWRDRGGSTGEKNEEAEGRERREGERSDAPHTTTDIYYYTKTYYHTKHLLIQNIFYLTNISNSRKWF